MLLCLLFQIKLKTQIIGLSLYGSRRLAIRKEERVSIGTTGKNVAALPKANEIVSSKSVVVFSKSSSPFCVHVKKLLTQLGANYKFQSDDQQIGLWSPLAKQGWKPCSESLKLPSKPEKSQGYIQVFLDGGLNQQKMGDKHRPNVNEKEERCVEEKLVDFCDMLNIPISRASVQKDKHRPNVNEKEERCVEEKLVDFCDMLNIPISKASVQKVTSSSYSHKEPLLRLVNMVNRVYAMTKKKISF
ncbi:hypothetical protein QN277_023333 [Acacia crassicarpa]|uniref:Uncharacterized protein n=1 Tax=Acacia crassicarpa TaxID=499986 RepID=A0AAE1MLV5_9FABA|nr:hypothetical protein QN277_023333 [Acacia crassicarpa]